MNHDMNKELIPTSLEEEAEVLVSIFLPSERTYPATTAQLTPDIVEELLEHFMDPVNGSSAKGRNQLACVVFMLMTCSLLALQTFWRSSRKLSSHNSRLDMKM